MADVTETLRPFDNSLKRTFINTTLREDRYPQEDEAGDPHPQAGELMPAADRLYFEKPEQWERSDGLELQYPNKTLKLDDTLDTLEPGDAAKLNAYLIKLYDAWENVT